MKVHAMVSVFQFIMKQSYICALIAMMVGVKGNGECAGGMGHTVLLAGSYILHLMASTTILIFPMSWQRIFGYINFSWDFYIVDFKIMSSTQPPFKY